MDDIRNILEFLVSREFVLNDEGYSHIVSKEQLWIKSFEESFKLLGECGFVKNDQISATECACYGITEQGKIFLDILRQIYPSFDAKFNI